MDGENNLPGKNHILPVKKKIGRPKLFWMAKKYLDDQKKFGRTDGIGICHLTDLSKNVKSQQLQKL